jgi:hypothetical protein
MAWCCVSVKNGTPGGPCYYNFAGRPIDITPALAPSLARQRAAPAINSAAPVVATPPMHCVCGCSIVGQEAHGANPNKPYPSEG